MAGFLKTKRQARQWTEQNGYTNGDFDSLYQTALGQSRSSGLRGMRARRDALFNTMQTAKNRDFIYEDQDAGEQAAYADLQKKYNLGSTPVEPRENDSVMDSALSAHGISRPAHMNINDRIQARQAGQAQTPTGESVEIASTATEAPVEQSAQQQLSPNPVEAFYQKLNQHRADAGLAQKDYSGNYAPQAQPATVGTPQATDATVETPAPGQPAQIQSAPVAKSEEPDWNSMSKRDAWALARKLKGKDGILEWNGQKIGLKYAEEVAAEKAAAAKAKAAGANPKTSTGATAQPSAPVATTTQVASPTTTAQTQVKMQEQVTTPATQVDSSQSSQPSNLTKPATIVARRDSTIQNSSAAPEVTAAQTLQNKDISKPWNKTYQLGNRTLTHDQMEDYLFDGKLNDPNLYHGAPTMSPVPEEYTKNTDTSRFTFGRPISTSKLYADRASNITPRQQYSQQDLTDELRHIDSQTYYNQKTRRQAINNAYAKYNASR